MQVWKHGRDERKRHTRKESGWITRAIDYARAYSERKDGSHGREKGNA